MKNIILEKLQGYTYFSTTLMDKHVLLALVLERQFPGRSSILSKRLVFVVHFTRSCSLLSW